MRLRLSGVSMILGTVFALAASDNPKATPRETQLSSDEIAVYNAFLESYNRSSPGVLNLGNRTTPPVLYDADKRDCLRELSFEEPSNNRPLSHELVADMFRGKKVTLVNPKRRNAWVRRIGMLEISEITFDVTRRFAVMTYTFSYGTLGGDHGGTLVFHNISGVWRPNRACSMWMS